MRAVSRRWRAALYVAGATLLAALVGNLTSPPSLRTEATLLSAVVAVLVGMSIVLFLGLRRPLALLTAVAAISLLWTVLSGTSAAVASVCPGVANATTRCSVREILAQAAAGLLLPIVPVILILPVRYTVRTLRLIYRRSRALLKTPTPNTSVTPVSASAKTPRTSGRVTPRGTQPRGTKKRRGRP